jgi:hypothetical protein
MKKGLVLAAILFFPAFVYVYFALGIPKVTRTPIYGPKLVAGKDTLYCVIPAFTGLTTGGVPFSSKAKLDGQLYVAVFIPPDSLKTMLPILAEDMLTKKNTYGYGRYVFFMPTDTAGNVPVDAPDMARELKLGVDTAFTVFLRPGLFDSLRLNHYFIHDPSSEKDPWQTTTDAVLIDRLGRIRGYYNVRYAADVKRMKEDVNHVRLRDEGVQTIEETTVKQKREGQ